jgi:hypothetical protein
VWSRRVDAKRESEPHSCPLCRSGAPRKGGHRMARTGVTAWRPPRWRSVRARRQARQRRVLERRA